EILVRFSLKPDCLPCIPTKAVIENRPITNDHWLTNSNGVVRMRLCIIDFYNMNDSYNFEIIRWEWVIHFAWKKHIELTTFINKNNDDKVKYRALAKKEKDEELKKEFLAKAQRAKINNN